MSEFHARIEPLLSGLLEPGERLEGFCAATKQGTFSGGLVALAVSDRRLLVVPLDRKLNQKGDPLSIEPTDIDSATAGGAGDSWANVTASLMSSAAVTLRLRTTGGEKLKLHMMRGTGPLGGLGGGEAQSSGIEALGRWFERLALP